LAGALSFDEKIRQSAALFWFGLWNNGIFYLRAAIQRTIDLIFYDMKFKSFKTVKICLFNIKFLARKLCIKILFCNHYFRPDPDANPGGPKTYGTDPMDPDADPEHWVTMYD
jgi:hypothetical protein